MGSVSPDTPLVRALIDLLDGVDAPLSIAGSVLSLTVATPCVFISIFVCGERFY